MVRYVTRWALTTGIHRVDGEYTKDGKYFSGGIIFVKTGEAFGTLEQAIERAREMARNKSAALSKQAAKFADHKWTPKVVEAPVVGS